jgi:hypothetical protein
VLRVGRIDETGRVKLTCAKIRAAPAELVFLLKADLFQNDHDA